MYIPINNLDRGSKVLIAGAGGGFDFLCGLPLASTLRAQGHEVVYANYSFTDLESVEPRNTVDKMVKVSHLSTLSSGTYFPEGHMSAWYYEEKKLEVPIYCFERLGIKSLTACYDFIGCFHEIDTVLLIDGGVDGIFRGDEYGLGTPSMDAISILAAHRCKIKNKYYIMTAFGSEGVNKEVAHAEALERISELTKNNGFLGVSSLLPNNQGAQDLISASRFIFNKMPKHQHSVIIGSLLKSLEGAFGYQSVNVKTETHPVWISPLTNLYWFFDLDAVAHLKIYYDRVINSDSVLEVSQAIEAIRSFGVKSYKDIPI